MSERGFREAGHEITVYSPAEDVYRLIAGTTELIMETDVLVVGAGPVGLMLAGELRLGGASVVVAGLSVALRRWFGPPAASLRPRAEAGLLAPPELASPARTH